MALYLVQHGKSLPKETDPDQGLSDEGVADTRGMVRLALDLGLRVGGILHSGKTRAQQTAEILAAALHPPEGIKEAQGLNPLDDVTPVDFPETGRRPHAGRPPALHGAAGGVVGVRFAGKAGYRVPEQRHRLLGPRRDQRQLGDPLGPSSEAWMKVWCLGFWVFGYFVVQNTPLGRAGTKHFEKVGLNLNLCKLNTGIVLLRPLKILYAKHTQSR